MKKIFVFTVSIALFIFITWDCSKEYNPVNQNVEKKEEMFNKKLKIQTEKSDYKLGEISSGNFILIKASLKNVSQDTLYTKLGDGINVSIDQNNLSIVKGTDGYFEKRTNVNKWNNLNLGIMFEGSKVIRILPSINYNLQATASTEENLNGDFRLRINYFKDYSQIQADTLKDISNIFTIINKN